MAFLRFFWVFFFAIAWGLAIALTPAVSAEPAPVPNIITIDDAPSLGAQASIVKVEGNDASFEARCERELLPTRVEVNWAPGEISYDLSQNLQALRERGIKSQQALQSQNFLLGLTEAALGSNFTVGMSALTDPQTGRTCMRPQIVVRVSAGTQKIAVASEFPKNSCAFREIMNHELQHARANDEHAMLVAKRLRAEMVRSLGNRVFYGGRGELEGYVADAVRNHWMPFFRQEIASVETDHAHIDRPAENRRVLGSCDGELLRVLKSRLI